MNSPIPLQYFLTIILVFQLFSAKPCPSQRKATWIVFQVLLEVSKVGPTVSSSVKRDLCWRDPKISSVAPQANGTVRSPHVKVQFLFLLQDKNYWRPRDLITWENCCFLIQTSNVLTCVFQLWNATLSGISSVAQWGVPTPLLESSPTSPPVPSAVRTALSYMGQLSSNAPLRDSGRRRSPPAKVGLNLDFKELGQILHVCLKLDCPMGLDPNFLHAEN